eukprot:XP_001700496.1 predicted protein [Chlamydomonas reinhardtii]
MFVQKLNPLTGEADWVLVNDPGLGDEDDASADLVATSSYLDMLTDSRRNAAYAAALRRVIPAVPATAAGSAHAVLLWCGCGAGEAAVRHGCLDAGLPVYAPFDLCMYTDCKRWTEGAMVVAGVIEGLDLSPANNVLGVAGGGYVELSPRTPLLRLDCTGHLGDVEGEAYDLLEPGPVGGGATEEQGGKEQGANKEQDGGKEEQQGGNGLVGDASPGPFTESVG